MKHVYSKRFSKPFAGFVILSLTLFQLFSVGIFIAPKTALAVTPPPSTITATAGTGGIINPSGSVSVPWNSDKTFTITPNTGYIVSDVLVDTVSVGRVNSYTFYNVKANHTIAVSFDDEWKEPTNNFTINGFINNPTHAYTSNDQRAEYDSDDDINSYYGFGSSVVPSGATINGIRVSIEGQKDQASSRTWNVFLSYDGGAHWTSTKNTGSLQTYDTTIVLGTSSDNWGYTLWTSTIINSNNFRVKMDATSGSHDLELDQLQVKIYYTPAPFCGDQQVNGSEVCDGNSQSCTTTNGYPGNQSCNAKCSGWNTCASTQFCGDQQVNGSEVCDGNAPRSCTTGDGYSGTETCLGDCSGWSSCVTQERCGDGTQNGNEECDNGQSNGIPYVPPYGQSGSYCSTFCTNVSVTGPYCGDGTINQPEETCELPNTTNNSACSQDITKCDGTKTQTRDGYGDCNANCVCAADNWSDPVCVKDTCGAACAVDADCNDQNENTTDTCNLNDCSCVHVTNLYCGDGQCNNGETCETCSQDCGPCQGYCGDGDVNSYGEQCDGTDMGQVPEGNFICSNNCKLIPVYESQRTECPQGTAPEKVEETQSIGSQDADGIAVLLETGKTYLFHAFGTFIPTSAQGYFSDAGYTTINNGADGWVSQYGIQGTGNDYAAHALLGDLGDGVGVINWGNYNADHVYNSVYTISTNNTQFVIGDRYADWFTTPYQNQSGMNDNSGNLSLDIYECKAETPPECTPEATQGCQADAVGACAQGTKTCNSDGFWGICVASQPTTENCSNGIDDDCDGYVDQADIDCRVCDPQVELITNGGFEAPVVSTPQNWNIFNTSQLASWFVEWMPSVPATWHEIARPITAYLELQKGAAGDPHSGYQLAELDSDWGGPSNPIPGDEPASVKIYQDINTIPGRTYAITYYFSARPGTAVEQNRLKFAWDGNPVSTVEAGGESNTFWTEYQHNLTATSATTRIQFSDVGNPDSYGTYLDDVSVKCQLNVCGDTFCDVGESCSQCSQDCGQCPPEPVCQFRDTQSCAYDGLGVCAAGTQTCGENGQWGTCTQNVQASTEICGNEIDEDCNGVADTCPSGGGSSATISGGGGNPGPTEYPAGHGEVAGASTENQGEVLGASTEKLPETGADLLLIMAIAILIGIGACVGIKKLSAI